MANNFNRLDKLQEVGKEQLNEGNKEQTSANKEITEEKINKDNPEKISDQLSPSNPEDVMYTDIDISPLFLGGTVTYTTSIYNKLPVTFRLLTSEELESTNEYLAKLADVPINVAITKHSICILSHSILEYNGESWKNKSKERRIDLLKKLPAILVNEITKRFSTFEKSVAKMLSDRDYLKN